MTYVSNQLISLASREHIDTLEAQLKALRNDKVSNQLISLASREHHFNNCFRYCFFSYQFPIN